MEQKNQPSVSPKSSNNKTVLILVIVFAILLFLGVGGYLVWKFVIQKKIQTLASTPKVTVTFTPSPSPSPSAQTTSSPTAIPTTASSGLKTGTMPINSYVISDSNSRVLSESELFNLTPWQLKVARNEIYARYGRPFVHKDLQCYFANQSWYHGNPNYSETMLSVVENKNVATIQEYEQKTNSPLQSFDSGC